MLYDSAQHIACYVTSTDAQAVFPMLLEAMRSFLQVRTLFPPDHPLLKPVSKVGVFAPSAVLLCPSVLDKCSCIFRRMCSAHDEMIRSQIALTIAKTIQLCQHDYPLQFRVPFANVPVLSLI